MSSSPGGLLQRLRELKQWQASHDELLKRKDQMLSESDSQNTIEGLSAFDTSSSTACGDKNWESTPIAPAKSFDELLEEKLAEDPGPAGSNAGPKRPFLKRGQGLQRFRMGGAKQPVVKNNKSNRSRDGDNNNDNRFGGNAVCDLINDVTPLKMPEIGMVVEPKATWCRVSENGAIQKINEIVNNGNSVQSDGPSEQTLYERQLEKELLLFEALERKVENSSFDSTNSSVIRMISSTPQKNRPKSNRRNSGKLAFPEPVSEERRVRFFEDEPETVVVGKMKETQVLSQLLTRLQNFKMQQPAVPPLKLIDCNEQEKWSTTSEGDDDDDLTSLSTTISSTDLEESQRNSCRDVATGTSDDFPSAGDGGQSPLLRKCPNCDEELRRKIQEYNERIKNVVEEKQKLLEMRKELDRRREADERDARKKRQEFHEERRTLEMEIENDRKKLAKERAVFQTHIKDSQNRTTKKEREDISNLKQEVADLKETLKLKESKNGMTQARLRNQVKQLERDNTTLRDQVEKLTRENAKLTATQKMTSTVSRRPSSDTKILHEINKNITKLTQEKQQKETTTTRNNRKKSLDDEQEEQDEEEEKPKAVVNASRSGSKAKSKNNNNNNSSRKEMEEIITGVNNRSCQSSGDGSNEMDMTNFRSVDVEKRYEQIFQQNASLNDSKKNDRTEEILEDGSKEITYGNGNVKTTSADGNLVTMKYFNGDIKKSNRLDGTIKYFFFDQNIWQHSEPDGLEIIEFSDGSKEKRYKDGTCEVIFPDGTFQTIHRDGNQEVRYPDGSRLDIRGDGEKVLHLPNGQKEIQTKEHKRREYPDGTVKILYPNGTQETRYATGRIRIKDPRGNLIMDTLEQ